MRRRAAIRLWGSSGQAICIALVALALAPTPGLADKRETEAELKALKARLHFLEKRVAEREKAGAQKPKGSNARVGSFAPEAELPTDRFYYKGVTITPGGYIAADSIWRRHWLGSDTSTPFQNIPYGSNSAGQTDEFRFSARESRQSLLVQGDVNSATHLKGYVETDFLAAAQTANSNQTNSYNPRIRQIWLSADWDNWGVHVLAGSPWSLTTLNRQGIKPDTLGNPPLIDGNLMVGYTYTRQPGLRIVKDLPYNFTAAFAVESAATTYELPGSSGAPAGLATVAGAPIFGTAGILGGGSPLLFAAGPGGSLFNSANAYSFNRMPDFIGKLAYDAVIADRNLHVEGFGILRDFQDRVYWGNHAVWGGGAGGGFVFAAMPKFLDVQGSLLIGRGVGRYGPAQLADATYSITGAPLPNSERIFNIGSVAHVTTKTDIYAFAGGEFQGKNTQFAAIGKTLFVGGVGNPLYNNIACEVEALSGVAATNPAGISTCSGQFKSVRELTGGFWHTFYEGDFGKLRVGAQYAYLVKDAFQGAGPTPKAVENQVMTTLRYYPF